MRGVCSTYGGEERHIQGTGGETRERDHLEDPGIDGRIILQWIFQKWAGRGGDMNWIDLAQHRKGGGLL